MTKLSSTLEFPLNIVNVQLKLLNVAPHALDLVEERRVAHLNVVLQAAWLAVLCATSPLLLFDLLIYFLTAFF